jgi:glyoxylase-like metal-dependent hydrolase (beta-lactamase superfamily II)
LIARPINRLRVINTEKYFDHIGGNGYFRTLGIDVWGHSGIMRTHEEFQAEIAEFNDTIANPARRANFEARAFFHETTLSMPNRPIQDELTFDLGDLNVEILLGGVRPNLRFFRHGKLSGLRCLE